MNNKQIENLIKNWYYFGVPNVDVEPENFYAFVGKGSAMLLPTKNGKMPIIRISDNLPTTAFDYDSGIVWLPRWLFSLDGIKSVLEDVLMPNSDKVLTLFNAFILHESLHSVYTNWNWEHHLNQIQYSLTKKGKSVDQKIVATCANIIEDLYIESPKISGSQWLSAGHEILFSKAELEKRISVYENSPNMVNAINVLICYKNANHRPQVARMFPDICGILDQALVENFHDISKEKRALITKDFILALLDDSGETDSGETDSGETDSGETDSGETDSGETDSGETDSGETDSGDIKENALSDSMEKTTKENHIDTTNERAFQIAHDKKMLEIDNKEKQWEHLRENTFSPTVWCTPKEISWEKHLDSVTVNLSHDKRLASTFEREIQALTNPKTVRKSPNDKGNKPNKNALHRIVVDDKIFRRNETIVTKDKPEVIILVDASGSMTKGAQTHDRKLTTLYRLCLGISKSLGETLKRSRIPFLVCGHTSSFNASGIETCELFPIMGKGLRKTFKPTLTDWQALYTVDLNGNIDGLALKESVKQFTPKANKKIIFVLSDGQPCSPGSGINGNLFLSQEIKKARAKEIVVISLSLVDSVFPLNTALYGKEYSINCANNTQKQITKALKAALA